MADPIYKAQPRPYHYDINDLIVDNEIQKGKALPIGTTRTWGGREYIKHPDGWVSVGSGRLTGGKNMAEVEGHANHKAHQELAEKHKGSKGKEGQASGPKVKETTTDKPITVHHTTDTKPRISSKEDRLIPGSMSASLKPDHTWG